MGLLGDSPSGDPNTDLAMIGGLLSARIGSNWPQLVFQAVQQHQLQQRQALTDQLMRQQIEGGGLDLTLKKQSVADQIKARQLLMEDAQPPAQPMQGPQMPQQPGVMPTAGVIPAPGGKNAGVMAAPTAPQQQNPAVNAPGVVNSGKNQTFNYYQALAYKMQANGLPDQAKQYFDLAEKYRPKLKDEQVRLDGSGKPVVVRNYEDGTTEVSPFQPTANLQYLDVKNAKLPINNYTGGLGGQPIPMGIDPADAQKIAIERQNAATSAAHLGIDRARLYFDTGMVGPAGAGGGVAPAGGGAPAGAPGLPPSVQAQIAKTTQEGLAKGGVDYKNALDNTVNTGNDLMMRIGESQKALGQFQTGMGAETRLNVARFAQAIGAPDALVNRINSGDVSAKQEFQKLAAQQAMETLKQSMGGSGRITQAEFKVFQANNPNIELDPNAIQKIYDFARRTHLRNVMEQNALNTYLQQPGANISQWPTIWTQKQMQAGLMPPQAQAAPQGGIRRYNPETGKIE